MEAGQSGLGRWRGGRRGRLAVLVAGMLIGFAVPGMVAVFALGGVSPGQEPGPREDPVTKEAAGKDETLRDFDGDCGRSGCHRELQTRPAPRIHGPVAVGACEVCHLPVEGSEHTFEYFKPREQLCTHCHLIEPLDQGVVHEPYAEGECSSCHGVHGGHRPALLKEPTLVELCESCHDGQPHGEEGKVLRSIREEIASAKFLHGPVAEGDCGACHRSHASSHPRLLSGEYPASFYSKYSEGAYQFCFECHDPRLVTAESTTLTGFRDGPRNLHRVHVQREKGRTCGVCHDVHGGSNEHLVRESVPFGPGGWKLPIGFKPDVNGGTCTSGCHQKLGYDRTAPSPSSSSPRSPETPALPGDRSRGR